MSIAGGVLPSLCDVQSIVQVPHPDGVGGQAGLCVRRYRHYTRLEERNGKTYIVAGDDDKKDQSYFLWRLGQEVLKRCIFPLGAFTKMQVRGYLRDKGYTLKAEEGESMEVCFIKGDYRDFLREHSPEIDSEVGPGWFVNSEGVKLGGHKGFPYYTIGQRKGLEIALGKPAYVLKINPQKNTVMLGDAEQLKAGYMLAEEENLIDEAEFFGSEELTVRIRYRSKPIPCTVKRLEDGRLLVRFLSELLPLLRDSLPCLRRPACGWRLIHRFPTGHRDVYCRK